jgi:hypothetical protein
LFRSRRSTDVIPAPASFEPGGSALKSLLNRAIPYEKAGAVIPHDLMQFGLFGSSIVIVAGLMALMLPSSAAIEHSSFYLLLGGLTANLDSLMGRAASAALICGGALLVLDAGLMLIRTSEPWRYAVIAQAAVGGVGGAFCTFFILLVVLNLVIWAAIFALVLVALGTIFAGMAGGG